ncbi:MutS-related protein [Tenacibaculum jejuense]|uniref:MutS-related protein, family 1 n=1 Tax=Tenacibaculum jejuense TaxID=584609 RepID=A0A238UEY5_9FLAO|nr:DNA mismatch repair protein MutS [Tenacibaculum jejuense]SNR17739.1 MutS-related protein, family 1 [Tenacibaculum jejuense]
MINHIDFYKAQEEKHLEELKLIKKQISNLSILRLLIFLATAFGIYLSLDLWKVSIGIATVGILIFVVLLLKYTKTKRKQELLSTLASINKEELHIIYGDYYHKEDGIDFKDPKHDYSLDIDLFGPGSFFQFINRTKIQESKLKLANLLTANHIKDIKLRQEAIKELATKPNWSQKYQAISSLIKTETSTANIVGWLKQYKPFVPHKMQWLSFGFSLISVTLFACVLLDFVNTNILLYWMILGLSITGRYLKKVNNLSQNSDKIKETFRQYSQLLNEIENETFTSSLLKEKQSDIQSEAEKASTIFNTFTKALDALDNRNNIIIAILGNGFFLFDIKNSYRVEQWINSYKDVVENWFNVVTFFDAYNSLGNYTFNHPEYIFPEIKESKTILQTESLGHPLLKKDKRVDNDIIIDKEQFFIITGANMAGKSTFLRTVSLNIVMANIGLPVCAKSCRYSPIKLITSMRTSDSLVEDSSYFFSELTRLKFIVDQIKETPYFIILDEILKGTNSTDKAIGSQKFVEKLVESNSTGIIATHDLSLCEIEKKLDEVKNFYFDAEIINDELYFDYRFKKGICQNMNASFLLKKMEII